MNVGAAGIVESVIAHPLWMILLTNLAPLGPDATVGDCTEPTFAGYARTRLTREGWQPFGASLPPTVVAPLQRFAVRLDTDRAELVTGYALLGEDGQLRGAPCQWLDMPVPMRVAGDALEVTPRLVGLMAQAPVSQVAA